MEETDISRVLRARLKTMPDVLPILYENKDKPETMTRPYLVTDVVRVSRRNPGVKGGPGGIIAKGFFQVTVITDLDQFDTLALTVSGSIALHFPKALRLTDAAGTVAIIDEPNVLKGRRDGPDWRTDVQIDYETS